MHPGKPRGYAFIEFEHKNDMKNAYKMADGRKVEGKRVTVDVERGRTVPNWCAPATLLLACQGRIAQSAASSAAVWHQHGAS